MKKFKCLVVDDELAALTTLKSYIEQTDGLIYVSGLQDSSIAKEILSDDSALPDIVFLDLEMKGIKGDQLAELVNGKVMIIFSTAHADFAVKSYEYGTIDYLLKPFSYERFKQAIDKCRKYHLPSGNNVAEVNDVISINDSRTAKLCIVPKSKIQYITAYGNYCKVFVEDIAYLMPLRSLNSMYESLNSDKFLRIHRAWVIHINQVQAYSKDSVTLKNGQEIKFGRVYKNTFKTWVERHGLAAG